MGPSSSEEMTVSDFLHSFAVPSFEEFAAMEVECRSRMIGNNEFDYKGMLNRLRLTAATAAVWVSHVLDWHWEAHKGTKICFGETDPGKFRAEFRNKYPEIIVAQSIADSAKHCVLKNGQRHPPRFEFVGLGAFAFGEGMWGEFPGDGGPCLIAYDANGTKRGVHFALRQTLDIWLSMERQGIL